MGTNSKTNHKGLSQSMEMFKLIILSLIFTLMGIIFLMNIRSIRIHHQLKPFYFASNIKRNLLKNFFNRSFMWKNLYNESDEMFFKLRRIYCIIGGLSLLKIAKFRIEKKLLVIFCRRFIPKKNKKKFSKKIKTLKGIEDELEHFKSVVYGDNIKITRRKNWLNLCSFLYVNVF